MFARVVESILKCTPGFQSLCRMFFIFPTSPCNTMIYWHFHECKCCSKQTSLTQQFEIFCVRNLRCLDVDAEFLEAFKFALFQPCILSFTCIHFVPPPPRIWEQDSFIFIYIFYFLNTVIICFWIFSKWPKWALTKVQLHSWDWRSSAKDLECG